MQSYPYLVIAFGGLIYLINALILRHFKKKTILLMQDDLAHSGEKEVLQSIILERLGVYIPERLMFFGTLSKIAEYLNQGNHGRATATLLKYCTYEAFESLLSIWQSTSDWLSERNELARLFQARKEPILSAHQAYKKKRYEACIQALLPQIEGIIHEWMRTKYLKESYVTSNNLTPPTVLSRPVFEHFTSETTLFLNVPYSENLLKHYKEWSLQMGNLSTIEQDIEILTQDHFTKLDAVRTIFLLEMVYQRLPRWL